MNIIFVFRSRTQSMKFYSELWRSGIVCSVINTPREVAVGCGLSVKISSDDFPRAVRIFGSLPTNTFLGAYKIFSSGGKIHAERLSL